MNNRQPLTPPQGCYCWELQDEPFAFSGRIGTACVDLRNRVYSLHLIGFLLRATKKEQKSTLKNCGIMSLKTPKAVFSASARKYTAAGGAFKHIGVVFRSDESRNKGIEDRKSVV